MKVGDRVRCILYANKLPKGTITDIRINGISIEHSNNPEAAVRVSWDGEEMISFLRNFQMVGRDE